MILANELSSSVVDIVKFAMGLSSPIIFPTDTIYGIGAFVDNIEANISVFKIKERPCDKPFPLLVSSVDMLSNYVDDIPDEAIKYLDNIAPTTVVLRANNKLDNIFKKDGTTAFRIPKKNTLIKMIESYGCPLTATSVNQAGGEAINNFDEIVNNYHDKVLLMIAGEVKGISSAIYDLTGSTAKRLR